VPLGQDGHVVWVARIRVSRCGGRPDGSGGPTCQERDAPTVLLRPGRASGFGPTRLGRHATAG